MTTISEMAQDGSKEEAAGEDRHWLLWLPVPHVLPEGQQNPLLAEHKKLPVGQDRHRPVLLPLPHTVPVGQHPLPPAHWKLPTGQVLRISFPLVVAALLASAARV